MKNFKILVLTVLAFSLLTACDNSPERRKAHAEKLTGTVQKSVGNLTNDEQLKNESKKNELKGDLRAAKEDVKDYITR